MLVLYMYLRTFVPGVSLIFLKHDIPCTYGIHVHNTSTFMHVCSAHMCTHSCMYHSTTLGKYRRTTCVYTCTHVHVLVREAS